VPVRSSLARLGLSRGLALGLTFLALVTREPLLGRSLGEADGARYLLGLEQWLIQGPGAPFVYAKVLSPGYYAAMAALVKVGLGRPQVLMDAASFLAAVISAPLLYWIGCQLTSPVTAALGTALFLLAPAVWWLGIEPHPQGISFLFFLLALAAFLYRRSPAWLLVAGVCLGLGLLVKNDLVLLCGVFPALAWRGGARSPRAFLASLTIPTIGAAMFLLGRSWILGLSLGASQHLSQKAVAEFWSIPHGAEWLKQLVPMFLAGGVVTFALVLAGLGVGVRSREWRRRWLAPVALWAAPGAIFWFFIRGNNARHMAPLLLLPLWAAIESLALKLPRRRRPGLAAIAAVVVLGLNWILVAPSSNTTLYPSANVPASQRDLVMRSRELAGWVAAAPGPACFIGNYTLPYMEQAIEQSRPAQVLSDGGDAVIIGGARFMEVDSSAAYLAAARRCELLNHATPHSLEYDARGAHERFLGEEWQALPWRRRWFPAGKASLHTNLGIK